MKLEIIGIVMLFVMILGCVESQPSQTSKPTTISPTVTSATPVQTPEIYYVGETASDGVTNITLKGIRYTATINERKVLTAPPGSKYLILDITLEIIKSGEVRTFGQGASFIIRDSEGYTYRNTRTEFEALKRPLDSNQNFTYPDKVRGELAFEVLESAKGLKLYFQFEPENRAIFKLSD